jgi:hypothetical protein
LVTSCKDGIMLPLLVLFFYFIIYLIFDLDREMFDVNN